MANADGRWVIVYSLQGSVGIISDEDGQTAIEYESLAEAEKAIVGHILDGAADLHFLNLENGVVELQTGVCP